MSDPLTVRIGDRKTSIRRSHPLLVEVKARGDNLAAVIVRDLERYYDLLASELATDGRWSRSYMHKSYDRLLTITPEYRADWIEDSSGISDPLTALALVDALERAHRLVAQGASVDDALA